MPNQAVEQLANTLKVTPDELADLSLLTDIQLVQLNTLITSAQQKQRHTLEEAIENGLNYIPAILRGAVKKIVRG